MGAESIADTAIRDRLSWRITPELYEKIRRLWINHSKAEDRGDLQGLIDTLSEDCVYEVVNTGERWEGHDGARAFYTGLLTACPDVRFDLSDIVIGPQGVFEVTTISARNLGRWLSSRWAGIQPDTTQEHFQLLIYFPWNPAAERFAGERIWIVPPDPSANASEVAS